MIHLACHIPENAFLACSGGVDSMVALDFLLNARKNPTVIHIDHGTAHGKLAKDIVTTTCVKRKVKLQYYRINSDKPAEDSQEEFWRNERYKIFHAQPGPVITAHHLNDAMEWWIMSSLHGRSKLIPIANKNVIRPFLLTPKKRLQQWASDKCIDYIDDLSNCSRKHMRNVVRHDIMPHALVVNPGLARVIKRLYKNGSV